MEAMTGNQNCSILPQNNYVSGGNTIQRSPAAFAPSPSSTQWTWEEKRNLENALAMIPEGTSDRWQRLANLIPGRSAEEVRQHCLELVFNLAMFELNQVTLRNSTEGNFVPEGALGQRVASEESRRGENDEEAGKKRGKAWTNREHDFERLLISGLERYGKGASEKIPRDAVVSIPQLLPSPAPAKPLPSPLHPQPLASTTEEPPQFSSPIQWSPNKDQIFNHNLSLLMSEKEDSSQWNHDDDLFNFTERVVPDDLFNPLHEIVKFPSNNLRPEVEDHHKRQCSASSSNHRSPYEDNIYDPFREMLENTSNHSNFIFGNSATEVGYNSEASEIGSICEMSENMLTNGHPTTNKRKGRSWTEVEHKRFLKGLRIYGKGDWRNISRKVVITRTPTQVASHAQKFFIRQELSPEKRKRSSIHDITTEDDDTSAATTSYC